MARFSGVTVLLILVATVSVYTCAILAGAALYRAVDSPTRTTAMQPTARDIALRVSVSVRDIAEDFAKELSQAYSAYQQRHAILAQRAYLQRDISRSDDVHDHEGTTETTARHRFFSSDAELWGGYQREEERSGGRAHPGAGDRAETSLPSSAARSSLPLSQAYTPYHQRQAILTQTQRSYLHRDIGRSDGVDEGTAVGTARPVSRHRTCSSDSQDPWGGYHREEGRSGGRVHVGAGDRAAAHASVQLSQAELELQYRQQQIMVQQIMVQQMEAARREKSRGGGMTTTTEQQRARPLSKLSNFSDEITEGTLQGVVKVGPWGGSGGQAFYMRGRGGGDESAPRLLSVTLYHADAVHGFRFEYLLGGVRRTMGPAGGHYSGSKGVRATINFSPDERLAAVEGTFGRCRSVPEVVVTSLTFRTDKGRTYGPYGEETGTPFSVPAANGCIVGFWGRSGWLLDAIGVYIMPCQVNDEPSFFVSSAYKATS